MVWIIKAVSSAAQNRTDVDVNSVVFHCKNTSWVSVLLCKCVVIMSVISPVGVLISSTAPTCSGSEVVVFSIGFIYRQYR